MPNPHRLAAIDLGSNSFRLEIGQVEQGVFQRTEYLKETVRQGNGLDEDRNLTTQAMQRGWDCLARFGERLAGFKSNEVRAVATQTLREARNRDEFLRRGVAMLGFPIDVISGREEARLIYQGVSQALPPSDDRRLVVDIGGRSTEIVLGRGRMPIRMESCRVGSITWSNRYFADQDFSKGAFQRAEVAAKAVLDEVTNAYPRESWDVAYGSAGTVGAVADVLAAAGWPPDSITPSGLDWLVEKLISAQSAERLRLPGLKDDRRALIGGGLSILRAVFELLKIDRMVLNPGGLRHGLLAELMGQAPEQSDLRARSVARLAVKFGAESAQSQRVGRVARNFLNALVVCKPPSEALATERLHRKLNWAADLHEIGSHISHSDYHKHGAYILDNADAMGFTQSELHRLSLLVLGHRGKLRKLGADFNDTAFIFQLFALRLAVILCHARNDPVMDGLLLSTSGNADQRISLHYAQAWGIAFPQSLHLLQEEVIAWQKTPWALQLTEANP